MHTIPHLTIQGIPLLEGLGIPLLKGLKIPWLTARPDRRKTYPMASTTADLEALLAPSPPRQAIAKISYSHDAMIALIIANPAISQNELAQRFGYTASWISQIISSDAFQSRLAERTKDLVDPIVVKNVEDRFKGLVLRSLEVLSEKLNKPSECIPDNLALRALELSSRALGYGARDVTPPVPPVTMNIHLEQLGSNLSALLHRKKGETFESENSHEEGQQG